MIYRIISFSIHNKLIIGLMTLAIIGFGIFSMRTINLGSVPDITNNQVQVMTVSPNLSTEDIEQFVTYPVEVEMGNLPGVEEIRSISRFGLSVVTIVFKEDVGTYHARQLVQEKLIDVRQNIPEKFGAPSMGPITTGLGEIYQYSIEVESGYDSLYTLTELRSVQDWIVARQLTLIEGVVGVNAFGGNVKQYEVSIDPDKLKAMGVTIGDVYKALEENNTNTGGAYIERNKMANFIRGEGLIRSLDDIRKIPVKKENGIPVTIGDIAENVGFGSQVRYGTFTKDGKEAVGGMVLMLKDANPNKVISSVKERIDKIQSSMPEGLTIVPFLDRSELIARTTDTVATNLIEGALIVIFALVILLGSFRGGLITATTIPLALLFAFILMKQFGVWANLMSLGAIDFGIIIDGAVIIIEGTVFEIQRRMRKGTLNFSRKEMDDVAIQASNTMMESAFFGQIIILIVFMPILFLQGVEGKMFQPMAYTFGFAMIGAIILCLTYVPMMSALFMRPVQNKNSWYAKFEDKLERFSNGIIGGINKVYHPVLEAAMKFRLAVIAIALVILGMTFFTFSRMGGEFIPQLKEGDLAIQALIRPGSSLEEMIATSTKIENTLLENFPEVKSAGSRIGVADIPTDPMPMDIADMFVILEKDHSKWTSAKTEEELIHKMEDKLAEVLVGVNIVFSQPIELRFNELLTGVREDVAIKIYGDDLEVLNKKAAELAELVQTVEGVGDVNAERTSGLPQINIKFDRDKVAQYGVSIEQLNTYLSTALAGGVAGTIYEGERRFDLVVRYDKNYRSSIDDIRKLFVDLPNGSQVMLKEFASIEYEPGPMQISRDDTYRQTYVGVNTRGRDVKSVVTDIQKKVAKELNLPAGYNISYGGEFENLESASNRLLVVVPIALVLIFILLYFALKSFAQSIMIYIAIPLAAIGGVYALWLRDMPFSISAGVGFIVLFGVAVLNGLVLINRFNSLKMEGITDIKERIFTGTRERIRPIMLTAVTDIFGFLPMAFSASAGAEVQRPLATVVIGGMISATLLTLVVLPVLYMYLEKRKMKKKGNPSLAMGIGMLFILVTPMFNAQTSLEENWHFITIEDAQKQALKRLPMLKAKKMEVEQQQVLKKTAWNFGNTSVYTGKDEVGNGANGIYTRIGIQQEGIDLFGIAPALKLQNQEVILAEKALELSELSIRREVKKAWADVYVSQSIHKVYETLDTIFTRISSTEKMRYELGDISNLSYLSTANEANELRIKKDQKRHEYLKAIQKLNLWLVSDTIYTVLESDTESFIELIELNADSVSNHPLLTYYQQQINIADAKIKKQNAQYFPTISGGVGEQKIGAQTGFYKYEIGISIPLIFNRELGRSQAAKIDRKIAEQNFQQQEIEIQVELNSTFEDYQKWRNTWMYYQEEALPLAQLQRESAITLFEEGAIDYTQFLQTVRTAIRIEVDAWDALDNYLKQRYLLEYYLQD
ncbi:CusA/CzcA family heavy metal efflux RND transporter [Brumimicrobium oceani]|uniref:CusA/CzcA family heavy metal efflux RND transporter n=1 Tax=Brumimicrobium oceani TaxID=2100725 RepID=A0A2U2X542_9FLAO|nr:CusA/CzcA family heavy metal efflux RND transporter [Brumimicrobium oceani]PWH82909.1 CusA/CzcA family heavy metal efflux RND transporter [Brumimicrobium oceani]